MYTVQKSPSHTRIIAVSPTAHSRAYSHHSSGPLSGLISHATFCHRMYFSRPVLIDVHAHRPCRVITMRPAVPRLASPPFPPSTAGSSPRRLWFRANRGPRGRHRRSRSCRPRRGRARRPRRLDAPQGAGDFSEQPDAALSSSAHLALRKQLLRPGCTPVPAVQWSKI